MDEIERRVIQTLQLTDGDKRRAAQLLALGPEPFIGNSKANNQIVKMTHAQLAALFILPYGSYSLRLQPAVFD